MVDRLTAAWFHILSALQAKPRCLLAVGRCDSIWSYCLVRVSGDVNCYLPPKGYAPDIQVPRKASIEALNLSNDEMYFNVSLSISI
jgi:hypothetical protein